MNNPARRYNTLNNGGPRSLAGLKYHHTQCKVRITNKADTPAASVGLVTALPGREIDVRDQSLALKRNTRYTLPHVTHATQQQRNPGP